MIWWVLLGLWFLAMLAVLSLMQAAREDYDTPPPRQPPKLRLIRCDEIEEDE